MSALQPYDLSSFLNVSHQPCCFIAHCGRCRPSGPRLRDLHRADDRPDWHQPVHAKDGKVVTILSTGRSTHKITIRRGGSHATIGRSWPITTAACSTPAVRPRSYAAGWAKLRDRRCWFRGYPAEEYLAGERGHRLSEWPAVRSGECLFQRLRTPTRAINHLQSESGGG